MPLLKWPLAMCVKPLGLLVLAGSLAGCGVAHSIGQGSRSAAAALFSAPVTELQLDFTARVLSNSAGGALAVPTLLRVYQLREAHAFEHASYAQLLGQSEAVLGDTLLAERALVLKPGGAAQLNMPLEEGAGFVGVVALLREPGGEASPWRLTLPRNVLQRGQPRTVELAGNRLALLPMEG